MTSFVTGAASLVGQVRSSNEDAFLVTDDLVAVADGMGGHRAGEVASADTVEVLRGVAGSRSVEDLVAGVHRANRRINERAATDDELRGMGTTVCVAGLVRYDDEDHIAVLNVGDSRVYLLADGVLTRLTEDHSLVETLVREGRISAEEAEHHPQRNVITRALGVEALVVVDAWLLRPCDGDRLLLCSDGLFGEVGEDRIAEILADDDGPDILARRLTAEADASGGRDNITVVVVDVTGTGEATAPIDGRYRRISTPAVDMSDPDEDGPHTETVMAVVVPAPAEADDDQGDDDLDGDEEQDDDEVDEAEPVADADGPAVPGTAEDVADDVGTVDDRDRPRPGDRTDGAVDEARSDDAAVGDGHRSGRSRPWRTLAFVVAVAVLIVVMVAMVLVWSRSGWVVTERDGSVVVVQGPKDGVLFIGPNVVARFPQIPVKELTDADQSSIRQGRRFDTREDAVAWVRKQQQDMSTTSEPSGGATTTPSTTTTAPSTVGPDGSGTVAPVPPASTTPPPAGQ